MDPVIQGSVAASLFMILITLAWYLSAIAKAIKEKS